MSNRMTEEDMDFQDHLKRQAAMLDDRSVSRAWTEYSGVVLTEDVFDNTPTVDGSETFVPRG